MRSPEESLSIAGDIARGVPVQGRHRAPSRAYPVAKRLLDIVLASLILVLTGPLILVAAACISCVSPGSPFVRVPRVGLHGRPIMIWKLRTMHVEADRLLAEFLKKDREAEAEWNRSYKLRNDPRIIPWLGKFLRKSSIDELPQFWDVIAGRMSLVGPRPFPDYHLNAFDPEFKAARCSVPPGLTGLWQVECRNEGGLEEQVYWDMEYLARRSFLFDLLIIIRTPMAVLAGKSAY
jgi:lipopolysaccharide/colanic/teichoic acid biosynthesis glycosyltransferase